MHSLAVSSLTFSCLVGLLPNPGVLGLEEPLGSSAFSLCRVSQMGRYGWLAYHSCQPIVEEMAPTCLLHAPCCPGEVSEIPRNTNTEIPIPDLGIRACVSQSGTMKQRPGSRFCVSQDRLAGLSCLNDSARDLWSITDVLALPVF